ncbi:hypothetical protein IFM89_030259 [Coptis chinensis]|uniref:Syntaxin N-terminal domain-containing protein n=1 Tax=Coptis chinensis TaxID=261450 RepID=A0A835HWE1_9MAGN|nr:hypothetical protein IFM89_030259 [Coptis chinensis]
MEAISTLLLDLQELNEETKSTHSAKILRRLRDRMDYNMVTVLRKAKIIKALRNRIVTEHKEGLKRRYYNATGKVATDEEIDKLVSVNGQVKVFGGHAIGFREFGEAGSD